MNSMQDVHVQISASIKKAIAGTRLADNRPGKIRVGTTFFDLDDGWAGSVESECQLDGQNPVTEVDLQQRVGLALEKVTSIKVKSLLRNRLAGTLMSASLHESEGDGRGARWEVKLPWKWHQRESKPGKRDPLELRRIWSRVIGNIESAAGKVQFQGRSRSVFRSNGHLAVLCRAGEVAKSGGIEEKYWLSFKEDSTPSELDYVIAALPNTDFVLPYAGLKREFDGLSQNKGGYKHFFVVRTADGFAMTGHGIRGEIDLAPYEGRFDLLS